MTANALPLTNPDDIIQLHPDLKNEYPYIKAHYNRIGLKHSENIIWDISADIIKQYENFDLSLFFFDTEINKIRPDASWLQIATYINNKNNFIKIARKMDLPIPFTRCFTNKRKVVDIESFSYPCFLKKAVSAGGMGVLYCQNDVELKSKLEDFNEDAPLQVQTAIKPKHTLNIQYIGCIEGLKKVAITEQLTDGYSYIGTRFPIEFNIWKITDPLAKWLYDRGMRGVFAFDIVVSKKNNKEYFYVLECNPRFNSASYYFGTAVRMGLSRWCGIRFKTSLRSIGNIDIEDLEYDTVKKSGIVLVEWGRILSGRIGILLAGNMEKQKQLQQEIKRRLS